MKKIFSLFLSLVFVFAFVSLAKAAKPTSVDSNGLEQSWQNTSCTTIQDGTLLTSTGDVITTGFDQWGYNYQSHLFNGKYCDSYHNAAWCQPYATTDLMMKWNDAWLANTDCGGDGLDTTPDGLLDRYQGYQSYKGSGAWITNHMKDTYEFGGQTCQWEWFTKIVAAPSDATLAAGIWYNADGAEIGPSIWGEFATIESVYNDPCSGYVGVEYLSPLGPGFGKY